MRKALIVVVVAAITLMAARALMFPDSVEGFREGAEWLRNSSAARADFGSDLKIVSIGSTSRVSLVENNCASISLFISGSAASGFARIHLRKRKMLEAWQVYEYAADFNGAQRKSCADYS